MEVYDAPPSADVRLNNKKREPSARASVSVGKQHREGGEEVRPLLDPEDYHEVPAMDH